MIVFPEKLQKKLIDRKKIEALRVLPSSTNTLIDFYSNDYLGYSTSEEIRRLSAKISKNILPHKNGATGSRLLSGNHKLYEVTENMISKFHDAEAALIFNSGYDANIGLFSSVLQRSDFIIYDELCHASIRDGIQMSQAKSRKFKHNDYESLEKMIISSIQSKTPLQCIYIVTESVFSMDGDTSDLKTLVQLCKKYRCYLIVDEAHAVGVFGNKGEGLVQKLGLQKDVFARIVTFGKALGCHGAAVLGSNNIKLYLINFARSFIYTTGLPPDTVATIWASYSKLLSNDSAFEKLNKNIEILQYYINNSNLNAYFISSSSAVHCCIIPGNNTVKKVSKELEKSGFSIKPIMYPTVPKGKERIRICIHSFNKKEDIKKLLEVLSVIIKNERNA